MNERLAHVLWLGGSPCSGKSTVAERICRKWDHKIYDCDDAWFRHGERVSPESHPVLYRLAHANARELWLDRPVQQQVDDAIASYRELFPLILADIQLMSMDTPIIAVGAALLPDVLAGIGVPRSRALWLVPSEAFQREHYGRREWRHAILDQTDDPERAWENWMLRDAAFAREVQRQAAGISGRVIVVDGAQGVDEVERDVAAHFGLR